MCSGKRQQRHVPKGHNTSNAPAVSGNADIRDSEGGRDEPDIASPCFSWITMLNVSMAMLRLPEQLKCAFGRCRMWFNSVKVRFLMVAALMDVQPTDNQQGGNLSFLLTVS